MHAHMLQKENSESVSACISIIVESFDICQTWG